MSSPKERRWTRFCGNRALMTITKRKCLESVAYGSPNRVAMANLTIEPVGDRSRALTELKLMLNDEPRRYTLLAVVHHEDKAYVIRCECIWEHRQIWQQDFRNALATLKFGGKD